MFNTSIYFNSKTSGHPVLEIVPAPGKSVPVQNFIPLKRTHLEGSINGPLASLNLKQTFRLEAFPSQAVIEALYRFPLPGDAAVSGVTVKFGDATISTQLTVRSQAELEYEHARDEGRQAVMLSRETPDVFTLAINGIIPGQDIEILTTFTALATFQDETWNLRIPLTTAPRYVREDELNSRQAKGQPLCLLKDPGHSFNMEIAVFGAEKITVEGLELQLERRNDSVVASLAHGDIVPDRDLLLQWDCPAFTVEPGLSVLCWNDPDSSYGYFVAEIFSPRASSQPRFSRDVVILVDHSGSMEGAKWAAADWAVKAFLNQLEPEDRFNLGIFHSYTSWWNQAPQTASPANIKAAEDYLDNRKDSGGTELGSALEQALAMSPARTDSARHLLIITDAEVSDTSRILALVDEAQSQNRKQGRRISVICIDSAPNSMLATEIALRSGGTSVFLTSDPSEDDITTALETVLDDFAQPLYLDAVLQVKTPALEASRQEVLECGDGDWRAIDIGDLPAGSRRWICGRLPASALATVEFELAATGINEAVPGQIRSSDIGKHGQAIKHLFGAGRLLTLEQLKGAGLEAEEISEILRRYRYMIAAGATEISNKKTWRYSNNQLQAMQALVEKQLAQESLTFGLISSATAFIAVREESGRKSQHTILVPNAVPHGWQTSPPQYSAPMRAPVCPSPVMLQSAPGAAMTGTAAPQSPIKRSFRKSIMQSLSVSFKGAEMNTPPDGQNVISSEKTVTQTGDYDTTTTGAPAMIDSFKSPVMNSSRVRLFEGRLNDTASTTILYDKKTPAKDSNNWKQVPETIIIKELKVSFTNENPDISLMGRDCMLLLYCQDSLKPAARIRLSELLRQGGSRPLNIRWSQADILKLVLQDPQSLLNGKQCLIELVWGIS